MNRKPQKQSRKRRRGVKRSVPVEDPTESHRGIEILGDLVLGLLAGVFGSTGHPNWAIGFGCASLCLALVLFSKWLNQKVKKRNPIWIVCGLLIPLCLVSATLWIISNTRNEELERMAGILIPATDPTPATTLLSPEEASQHHLLFLGKCLSMPLFFPHTVIAFNEKEILTVATNTSGLAVSCEFFSKSGNIVALLQTNVFTINPQNYFRRERPDRSTLVVYDQENIEVLRIRFMNPKVIKLTGKIRIRDGPTVNITEDYIQKGDNGGKIAEMFMGPNMIDINVGNQPIKVPK